LKKVGGRHWRRRAQDRDGWKLILMEVTVLEGLKSQWKERERERERERLFSTTRNVFCIATPSGQQIVA
jgi:hypothetical protein